MSLLRHLALVAAAFGLGLLCCSAQTDDRQGPEASVRRLSLRDALDRTLSSKPAQLETSTAALRSAEISVKRAQALTAFQLSGSLAEREVRIDLRTLGINLPRFPLTNPPQYMDTIGPFGVLEPGLKAVKTLIDRASRRQVSVAHSEVSEAQDAVATERETIAAATAREYLLALRTSEQAEAAQRELELAETLQKVAEEKQRQNLGAALEVRRARIATNGQRQKLSATTMEQKRALLRLMYLIGADLGDTVVLTDVLLDKQPALTQDQAIAQALQQNPRLLALQSHAQTLKLRKDAISAERLPVLAATADTEFNIVTPNPGATSFASTSLTYNAAVELRIPILDGHRRNLESAEVLSQLQEQQVREQGMRRDIELQTRLAFAALQQARQQLELARQDLSEEETSLTEMMAAKASGTASGVEVQQAQTDRASAKDAVVAALYAQEEARLSLAEAIGNVSSLDW